LDVWQTRDRTLHRATLQARSGPGEASCSRYLAHWWARASRSAMIMCVYDHKYGPRSAIYFCIEGYWPLIWFICILTPEMGTHYWEIRGAMAPSFWTIWRKKLTSYYTCYIPILVQHNISTNNTPLIFMIVDSRRLIFQLDDIINYGIHNIT
jgi:hypothetical protein